MATLIKKAKKQAELPERVIRIYNKDKELKEFVERYYENIHENRMTTKEALADIAEKFTAWMNFEYYNTVRVKSKVPSMPFFNGATERRANYWEIQHEGFDESLRPKKIVPVTYNSRYDIFGYKDGFIAIELGDLSIREKILELWHKYEGTINIPETETVKGILFPAEIDKTDTAFIKKKGKLATVKISDLILEEVKVEYCD